MIVFPSARTTALGVVLMALLSGLAIITTQYARADSAPEAALDPLRSQAAPVTIEKDWSLSSSVVCEPVLQKTADVDSASALFGSATLNYTIRVDHVDTAFVSAQIDTVTVTNTGTLAIHIDITDTLYCDAGGGLPGALVTQVFTQTGIVLSPHQSTAIPGGIVDITACGTVSAVNLVEVFQADTSELIASQDFADPPITALGCAVALDALRDVTTLPAGYMVDPNSIVVERDGQPIEPMSLAASSTQFTITLDNVSNVTTATYALRKEVVRQNGSVCQPGVISNVASALNHQSKAQINLTCGPLYRFYLSIVHK